MSTIPQGSSDPARNEPPPLNVDAVRRARAEVEAHSADLGGMWLLVDLLEAYDNLAARYAWLAANAAAPQGCPTVGCFGDGRYAAPGRGHAAHCHHPGASQ